MTGHAIDESFALDTLDALLSLDRIDEFLARLDDDATWCIPGNWPHVSGLKDRSAIERFVKVSMPAGFPYGVRAEIRHVHLVGNTAIIEFAGQATTSKDREYDNSYCFVFEFRDGRVYRIREYMDTLYANAVLHT